MTRKNAVYALLALWLAMVNCNLPANGTGDNEEATETFTAVVSEDATATFTAIPSGATDDPQATPTQCSPNVTANVDANIRSGPGTVYDQIGALLTGQSADVTGKNADSSWWYISKAGLPGGTGWISGSTVTTACLPASVAVIAAPPTPTPKPVSGSCKDGFVFRLIKSSDKVCVPPASKTQADADNAAANSRKLVTVYGASACKDGYVWREAYTGDVVCVIPATRSQAQSDNAAAASRVDPAGAFGPNTCVAGYVWREANATDVVCVTPAIRTQTAADNAAASSRVAGPDECISGYVWREAFSGDKVCVTPAIRSQVAADNAAAPGYTNP